MLSKNTLKFIKSLQQKKFRKEEQSFFVEGSKNVTELLQSDFEVTHLLFTEKFASEFHHFIPDSGVALFEVSQKELENAGTFQSNDSALAVAKIKDNIPFDLKSNEWAIALDDVRDPGNLGTILRIADWYGINKLLISNESADIYNPKVLHASMGSFTRVAFFYTDLEAYFTKSNPVIYGAFLEGENIYDVNFGDGGIILMGNESNGISHKIGKQVNRKISIPKYGHAESLNVAIATSIICDNIRRQEHIQSKRLR
ncbi:TrmH family RNA methyltransferase [Cecembia calidifontis]|uniref:TrmH family RNA methyltransferase n=1 Tax=Cecembia calidifontis TaxID=1187080 RepID=A0A4Q7PBJ3_9BACT|nr:RNA methyltransferase [Cecembia calidifontis]RZS97624.1 TrmH family RNA methyltransferase [Cecembia calidifontis]